MGKAYADFFAFLKKPYLLKLSKDKSRLINDFLSMLLLGFLFALVISLVNFLLVEFKLIKDYQGPDLLKKYGVYGTFFVGCILAPVLEESVFRWHLRKRVLCAVVCCWLNYLVYTNNLALLFDIFCRPNYGYCNGVLSKKEITNKSIFIKEEDVSFCFLLFSNNFWTCPSW